MDAAAKLGKEGIVKAILVSGDNASKYYNEPASNEKLTHPARCPFRKNICMTDAGY